MPRSEIDVHHQNRGYELAIRRVSRDTELLPANRDLLLEFDIDMIVRGIIVICRTKYLMILPRISKIRGKSFREATK